MIFLSLKFNFGNCVKIIGDVRFAENVSAKNNAKSFNLPTTICEKKYVVFDILYYQQLNQDLPNYNLLTYNLPTYNLPKHHFNDANVVLMTCNDRQYWSKWMSEGLRAVASTERLSWPRGRASFRVGKSWLFGGICWIVRFRQIVSQQIMCRQIVSWQIELRQIAIHPK